MQSKNSESIPKGFLEYFKDTLRKAIPNVNQTFLNKEISKIYGAYLKGFCDPETSQSVQKIAGNNTNTVLLIQLIQQEAKLMKKIYQTFDQMMGSKREQFIHEQIEEDKLTIFLSKDSLIDQRFEDQIKSYDLEVENLRELIRLIDSVDLNDDQNKFKENSAEILIKTSDFCDFREQDQQQILQKFYLRKAAYQLVKTIIQDYQLQNSPQIISKLYDFSKNKLQSQGEFNIRVKIILAKYCTKIKRLVDQKIFQITSKLYTQISTLDKQTIIQILNKSGLKQFSKPENVTFQILKQIYLLQNQTQLTDSQKFIKNEAKSPQKTQSPSKFSKKSSQIQIQVDEKPKYKLGSSGTSSTKNLFGNKNVNLNLNRMKQDNLGDSRHSQSLKSPIYNLKTERPTTNNRRIPEQMCQSEMDQDQFPQDVSGIYSRKMYTQNNEHQDSYIYQQDQRNMFSSQIFNNEGSQSQREYNLSGRKNQSNIKANQKIKLNSLQEEIKSIMKKTLNSTSIEVLLRQLQICVIKQNEKEMKDKIILLSELIKKYELDPSVTQELEGLNKNIPKNKKIPKIKSIRRNIQSLNLQEILTVKQHLTNNKSCKNAEAIVIIGQTGVGKSTLLVGMSGQKLIFNQQTGDYQPRNDEIAKKFVISNSTASVTRWSNISTICQSWVDNKNILIIDTPGLSDNRGPQTDITNNIGTVQLLKNLQYVRVVIVLSKLQFKDRWYKSLKQIIIQISQYLYKIKTFKNSIVFVLSKGLKAKTLLDELKEFKQSDQYKSCNWNTNQLELIKILNLYLQKLVQSQQSCEIVQIQDPAKHNYSDLVDYIMDCNNTKKVQPSDSFFSSYSDDTKRFIEKTHDYLNKMIISTFQYGQFALTKFYIKQMKQLQTINLARSHLIYTMEQLRKKVQIKQQRGEQLLDEYIEIGSEKALKSLKQLKQFLKNPNIIQVYNEIFGELYQKNNHLNFLDQKITKKINQAKDTLATQKVKKQQIKSFKYSLKLIEHFYSEKQYQQILFKQSQKQKQIVVLIQQYIRDQNFQKQNWNTIIDEYLSYISLDVDTNGQSQKQQKIFQIVDYYLKNNPKKDKYVKHLLDQAKKRPFDGKLNQLCSKYFTKILAVKEKNRSTKQIINKEILKLNLQLQKLIIFFQEEQQKSITTFDMKIIEMWETFQKNKQQIYRILLQYDDHSTIRYRFQKHQQVTFNNIQSELRKCTNKLQSSIRSFNAERSNIASIQQNLDKIFKLNEFIRKRKQISEKNQAQTKITNSETRSLTQTLKKSEETLRNIEQSIYEIGNRQKIERAEVNCKLIICVLVLKKFTKFKSSFQNQKNAERQKIQTRLKQKLFKPLNEIQTITFKNEKEIQLFYKIIRYFKNFQSKLYELGVKYQDFNELNDLEFKDKIEKKLKQGIQKFYLEFQTLKWVAVIQQFKEESDQQSFCDVSTFSEEEEDQIQKQINTLQNSTIKQKKNKSFSDLLLSACKNHIFIYRKMHYIFTEFMDEFDILNQEKQTFETQKNLFEMMEQKILNFQESFNLYQKSDFKREQLIQISKQLNFLLKLYTQTRINTQKNVQFERIKTKLDERMNKCIQTFQNQLQSASISYRNIKNGVQLEELKKLVKNLYKKDKTNLSKVQQLLTKMFIQYDDLINKYDPQINQKIGLLYSASEFKLIANQVNFNGQYNSKNLKFSCINFFGQIFNDLDYVRQNFKKGKFQNQKQIRQLRSEQTKIQRFLPKQYDEFKAQKNKGSIKDCISIEFQQIKQNIQKMYMSQEYVVDQKYREIYQNSSEKNRQRMKNAYIDRNRKQIKYIQSHLDSNHLLLEEALNKKFSQLEIVPDVVCLEMKQACVRLLEQKDKQINQFRKRIQKSVEQKKLTDLLTQYDFAQKRNSEDLKSVVIQSIESIYNGLYKQLDLNNFQKAGQIIDSYLKFSQSQAFKKFIENVKIVGTMNDKFLSSLKTRVASFSKVMYQKLVQDKKIMIKQNPPKNFKLSQFKYLQTQTVIQSVELYKLLTYLGQFFNSELTQFVTKVKQIIATAKNQFEINIVELNEQIQKMSSKQVQDLTKQKFIDFIIKLQISKQNFTRLIKFNQISEFTQLCENQLTNKYEQSFGNLQLIFTSKYHKVQKWSIQNILTSDTHQRKTEEILDIIANIAFLQKFLTVIISTDLQISENVLQDFQIKNQKIFIGFQTKTLEDIDYCFKFNTKGASGQNVRKFYEFIKLIDKLKNKLFPKDLNFSQNVKQQLIKKFQKNIDKIKEFKANPDNAKNFNALISTQKLINEKQSQSLKKILSSMDTKRKQVQNYFDTNLQTKIKALDNTEDKDEKIQLLNKQFDADKTNKLKDLSEEQFRQMQKIKSGSNLDKQKIIRSIQNLIEERLVTYLIIHSYAKTYFDCQQKILKHPVTLQKILADIQKNYSKKMMKYIYNILKQDQNPASQELIAEQKVFKSFRATIFSEETKGQTFDKLIKSIDKIQSDSSIKNTILKRFAMYEKEYNQILDEFKFSNDTKGARNKITNRATQLGKKLSQQYKHQNLHFEDMISLLSHIFGLWTILEAEIDDQNNITFIFKPHSGQILAIFLLLQLQQSNPEGKIQKKIIQVSTGEGKSVLLGALSAYLALSGFEVYEACYSKYLSSRDYKQFQNLFIQLNIYNLIRYDIFPQICKMMLDQTKEKTFISKVQKYVIDSSFWNTASNFFSTLVSDNKKIKKILLIDEADVFLDQNYIGQSYYPSFSIRKESVKGLLDFVWSQRNEAHELQPSDIIECKHFQDLCKQINESIFKEIMKNQTHAMIRDLRSYKNDIYSLIDGKIYYKEGDGLSDKIHYGYRTIFAYYHQHYINKQVTSIQLANQTVINLIAAGFSYTRLPQYFNSILGVTGTLESMSKSQKVILQKVFQVKTSYIQPSIYPLTRRKVNFLKCTFKNLFENITKDVEQQHAKNRPIIIFFKTKHEVYNFFHSKEFQLFKNKSNIITYEIKQKERDFRILTSAQQNKITLLTSDFARGTDFKLTVKDKQNHPGLHVISAFLPKSFSEYIQIIGRTGRQGRNGTVTILMPQQNALLLEAVKIQLEDGQKTIKEVQTVFWYKKMQELKGKMKKANQEHDQNLKVYTSKLIKSATVFANIEKLNFQRPITVHKSRTIICLDGTGSMSAVFEKIKSVIENALPDIYESIDKAKVQGQFEIKFVIYRNYNSNPSYLLDYSNFQTKKDNLLQWIKSKHVSGGWGDQAIEVAFQHINKLKHVDQFIIIGDSTSQQQNQILLKRGSKGEAYWKDNNFPLTTYEAELDKIIKRKIKGHSYYLDASYTKDFYNTLSKKTGGISQQFDIGASDATKKFGDFVANRILQDLGEKLGDDAKKQLLREYENISSKKKYV